MAKDDYIEVVSRTGQTVTTTRIVADKQGRVVTDEWSKDGNIQWFTAGVETRGHTKVRSVSFAASEIISIETFRKET